MQPFSTTGLVLAGGQARRMGGIDKGLQEWQGIPLVEWVLNTLESQVNTVLISANRSQEIYAAYGYPVIPDAPEHIGMGPLAGIFMGLQRCSTQWLLVCPCDVPDLPKDTRVHLADAKALAAYVQHHPAICLLHKSLLPSLQAWLHSGQCRVSTWLHQVQAVDIPVWPGTSFRNFNTLSDLAAPHSVLPHTQPSRLLPLRQTANTNQGQRSRSPEQ